MRRSVREAIVGFSLLAAISSAVGLSFWLRGISLNRNNWTVKASFSQAPGLGNRSAVVYRGVQVGNVRRVTVTPGAVIAELEITKADLQLAKPAYAEISEASLLGGGSQVSLVSTGPPLAANSPSPNSKACNRAVMLCNGSSIEGNEGSSLSTLTALMYKMMLDIDQNKLVSKFSALTTSFDQTSKDASAFIKVSQDLAKKLETSVDKLQPTITNFNTSTAHLRNILTAFDNPKTVEALQVSVSNAEQLTAKWNAVGGDMKKLTEDPKFMDGVRSLGVGLGKLFDELYPERKTSTASKAIPIPSR